MTSSVYTFFPLLQLVSEIPEQDCPKDGCSDWYKHAKTCTLTNCGGCKRL